MPLFWDGVPVLTPGTRVTGKTSDVKAATTPHETATLRLLFEKIQAADGKDHSFSAALTGVDNARESISADGLITGITASQTWGGRIDQGIDKVTTRYPGLGRLLGSVRDSIVKEVDASIAFPSGTDLDVKLTKPLDWKATGQTFSVDAIQPADELTSLVSDQPNRTTAVKPPKPSDLTNLMFIGSREQLENAFKAAGWSTADPLSNKSTMETARAIIEDRGYHEAPVSLLLLEGKPPDLIFQKQTNTFAMRHHIRIWQRPQTFQGQSIWVGAATHDIGIDFSEESRSFTHKIDSNIDAERSKVVNDLLFARAVHALALVGRAIPANVSNATGDQLITDGSIAVLLLQSPPEKGDAVSALYTPKLTSNTRRIIRICNSAV